jgi:5-methylcytosine-specific restriction protein A
MVPEELITLHHLTPKERGGKPEHRVPMCKPCHKQVHAVLGNKELAKSYATIEKLREAPELQTFLAWIRKQRADRVFRTASSTGRPRSKREKRR